MDSFVHVYVVVFVVYVLVPWFLHAGIGVKMCIMGFRVFLLGLFLLIWLCFFGCFDFI